jgi:hypothetical protein
MNIFISIVKLDRQWLTRRKSSHSIQRDNVEQYPENRVLTSIFFTSLALALVAQKSHIFGSFFNSWTSSTAVEIGGSNGFVALLWQK